MRTIYGFATEGRCNGSGESDEKSEIFMRMKEKKGADSCIGD